MAEGETAWCLGVAESGRRPLTDHEHATLTTRLSEARKALWFWRVGWRLFWIGALLAFPFLYEDLAAVPIKKGGPALLAVPIVYLLFTTFPAAALVSVAEMAVGGSRGWRWSLAALWLALCSGLVLGAEEHSGQIGFSALGIYLGGSFMLVLRWQIFRKLRERLPLLEADVKERLAAQFELSPPGGALPPLALARENVRFDGGPVRFEALPRTGVLVGVEGRFVDSFRRLDRSWDPLDVTTTTKGAGYRAPLRVKDAPQDLQEKFGQRHATRAELAEIVTHRKRLFRRGIGSFFGVSYFSAFGLRFVEATLEGSMKVTLGPVGWTIAIGIGVFAAWHSLRLLLALGRALKEAKLLSVQSSDGELEFLMGTDILWSVNDTPAPWRTVKW